MQPENMILVSVDNHLVESPNLFEGRVARKYADHSFDQFQHRIDA